MSSVLVFYLTLCSVIINELSAAHLPAEFKTCKKSDPNYENCIKSAVEDALHVLKDGNKNLGINSLEPLEITEIRAPGSGTNVKIDQKYMNLKIYGLYNSKISKFRVDLDKCLITIEATTPAVNIRGDYDFKGQLLLIPINSQGKTNNTLYDLETSHEMKCEKFEKKGKEYLRLTDYKITLKPRKVHFHYDEVFKTDKAIADQILKVLDENAEAIFDDARPDWEYSFGIIFKEIANRFLTRIPHDEIFLE